MTQLQTHFHYEGESNEDVNSGGKTKSLLCSAAARTCQHVLCMGDANWANTLYGCVVLDLFTCGTFATQHHSWVLISMSCLGSSLFRNKAKRRGAGDCL